MHRSKATDLPQVASGLVTTREHSGGRPVVGGAAAGPTAPLADRRGLTAAGGALLALTVGGAGLAYDLATGAGLRLVFAVCFIAACCAAALLAHREDLFAMVVMPPLAYLALSVAAAVVERAPGASMLSQQAVNLANTVVLGAPVLLSATAGAGLVAMVRGVLGRQR